MTPLHIQIMLWYYARPTPYAEHEPEHANSEATKEYTEDLINWGMLETLSLQSGVPQSTSKGDTYVEYLCRVPVPTLKYIIEMKD